MFSVQTDKPARASSAKALRSRRLGKATERASERGRPAPSSAGPTGLIALHLKARHKAGVLFVASDESRAERLGGILQGVEPGWGVSWCCRASIHPFDEIEPSRETTVAR